MNTAQTIFQTERRQVSDPRDPRNPRPSIFGWQSNFEIEREARLRRQQRSFRIKNFLGEHGWELNAILIFFLLIGVAVFFMTRTLAALDRVHELQREIQILRALAN